MITSSGSSASAIAMITATHAAGELVRVRAHAAAVDPDEVEQVAGPLQRVALAHALVRFHHVHELVADSHDGLSALIALWNTIETLRQR